MAYGIGSTLGLVEKSVTDDLKIVGLPARVVDIILDDTHDEWSDQGEIEALGAIKYRIIGVEQDESDPLELDIAYPLNSAFKVYPLLNEIVLLYSLPDILRDDADAKADKMYYTTPLAMWNNPEANPFPDTLQNPGDAELGYEFEAKNNVAPLQPFQGDVTIEGRQGQSIRFTGVDHSLVEIDNDDQKPITIISNGKEGADPDTPIVEVIDDDPASIYLLSDHTVSLTQANEKRDAWDGEPDLADAYKGSQVMINSGRLFFNAKEESILFSATDAIGGNAKRVSFDGEDYVALDATKVYLGTAAFDEREPVLLGKTTQDWMKQLLDELKRLGKALAAVVPAGSSAGGLAQIKSHGASMGAPLSSIKSAIDDLDSEKVFTE
tara:strand:+ start:3405 stop:4544 length:1140 start_codon:yes stop_codon:yes gene_type:complete